MITLDRLNADGMPTHKVVKPDTKTEHSGSGITATISKGLKNLKDITQDMSDTVRGWFV